MTEDERLQQFIEEKRPNIRETIDEEGQLTCTTCTDAAALGYALLLTGQHSEAQEWFDIAAKEQLASAKVVQEAKLDLVEEGEIDNIGHLAWLEFHDASLYAPLSGDTKRVQAVGSGLFDYATDPELDSIDGWDTYDQPYFIAALGALYLGRSDAETHLEEAFDRLEHMVPDSIKTQNRRLYGITRAIAVDDEQALVSAVEKYLDQYHCEHVVGNDEGFPYPFQQSAYQATPLVVVARMRGLDVRVDSEYVPDVIYDEEYYPLGGL